MAVDAVQPAHQAAGCPAAALSTASASANDGAAPPRARRASRDSPRARAGQAAAKGRNSASDRPSSCIDLLGPPHSIRAARACASCVGRRRASASWKWPQHGVQPVAEVALVDLGVELVGARAGPAGAARKSGRGSGAGLRRRWWRCSPAGRSAPEGLGYFVGCTATSRGVRGSAEGCRAWSSCSACTSGLGRTGSPLASDWRQIKVARRRAQGRGPGRALCMLPAFRATAGPVRGAALRVQLPGRLGRCRQAAVVAAGNAPPRRTRGPAVGTAAAPRPAAASSPAGRTKLAASSTSRTQAVNSASV